MPSLSDSAHPEADPEPTPIELTERFYGELRGIAERLFAHERGEHTLQPTAVVNEACMRILTTSPLSAAPSREAGLALAARVLRQVLVDHHRGRAAEKRGGAAVRVELDPDLEASRRALVDVDAVHDALERLRALHERQAEVVTLRVFGGLTVEQVAAALGVSKRTVEGDWTVARAWLRRELAGEAPAE